MESREKDATSERGTYLESPIALNNDMELANEDTECVLSHKDFGNETMLWKTKQGFPSYHLNPERCQLIVLTGEGENQKLICFRLKKESTLLKQYIKKYVNHQQLKI